MHTSYDGRTARTIPWIGDARGLELADAAHELGEGELAGRIYRRYLDTEPERPTAWARERAAPSE